MPITAPSLISSNVIRGTTVAIGGKDESALVVRVADSGVDRPRPGTAVPSNPIPQLAPPAPSPRRVDIPATVAAASEAIDNGRAKEALALLASIDPELQVARQAISNILGNCDCEQEEFERLSKPNKPGLALQYVREADRLLGIARQLDLLQFIVEQESRPTAELRDALDKLRRKNDETYLHGRNSDHIAFSRAIASVEKRIAETGAK